MNINQQPAMSNNLHYLQEPNRLFPPPPIEPEVQIQMNNFTSSTTFNQSPDQYEYHNPSGFSSSEYPVIHQPVLSNVPSVELENENEIENLYDEINYNEVEVPNGNSNASSHEAGSQSTLSISLNMKVCGMKRNVCYCLLYSIMAIIGIVSIMMLANFHKNRSAEIDSALEAKLNATVNPGEFQPENMRGTIKSMFLDAWNAYHRYAWGDEQLNYLGHKSQGYPNSNIIGPGSGLSIVASMSTMWVMGLKKEFDMGKQWIANNLDLSKMDFNSDVYQVIVQYVGGLLSCYALTGDSMFLDHAKRIAKQVQPAFDNSTGFAHGLINFKTGEISDYIPNINYVSKLGGFTTDYNYLIELTGDPSFREPIAKSREPLRSAVKPFQLYNTFYINGSAYQGEMDLFGKSNHFHLNLVNEYIQSNGENMRVLEMYKEAIDSAEGTGLFHLSQKNVNSNRKRELLYAQKYNSNQKTYSNYMEDSGCLLGGILTLGANSQSRALNPYPWQAEYDRINRQQTKAEEITKTCYLAANQTLTGLTPQKFYFNSTHNATAGITDNSHRFWNGLGFAYSNFILWRQTHDPKYREYAAQYAQALFKHCRWDNGGYSEVTNVNQVPTRKDFGQDPILFSAIFKYLYLTFVDDSVLSLGYWIFNSAGHPLPICGATFFRRNQCELITTNQNV